jgi:hypothetical protein
MKIKRWRVENVTLGENEICALFILTGVFHESQFARQFHGKFREGDKVTVTLERGRRVVSPKRVFGKGRKTSFITAKKSVEYPTTRGKDAPRGTLV